MTTLPPSPGGALMRARTLAQSLPCKRMCDRPEQLPLVYPLPQGFGRCSRQEYEDAASPEAGAVKVLDELETIFQPNQDANPPGFDYAFNLDYGREDTGTDPLFALIRGLLDDGTRGRIAGARPRDT